MEKHLFYYTSHSQYSEPTDKPAVSYCELEDEVHYHPDPFNGHAYVDLGLPSGTLWATMNVGANSETDYGLYFAWGETQGYTASQVSGSATPHKDFSWSDYALTEDSGSTMSKYNAIDNKTHIELTDDAAHANMGGDWHMPNREQCIELFSGTSNGFITSDGTYTQYNWSSESSPLQPDASVTASTSAFNSTAGHIFFKKSYTSVTDAISAEDYLFIPAAGYCYDGGVYDVGELGHVWSSSLNAGNVSVAWSFYFGDFAAGVDYYDRCHGRSVRGVVTPAKNLITFTIVSNTNPDQTKQAEEGMTWQEWVNSKYNTNGYYIIYNSGVWNSSQNGAIENVTPQDVIVANTRYNFSYAGGASD